MIARFAEIPIKEFYPAFVLAPDELVISNILHSNSHGMPIRTCNYMCIYRYQPE
jgi:hypothetical protein